MLEAGVLLLAERGLSGLTLTDVGKTAGYSRGLPAHHFGTKEVFEEKLFEFLLDKCVVFETPSDVTPGFDGLLTTVTAFFEKCSENPVYSAALKISLSDSWDKLISQKPHRADLMMDKRQMVMEIFEFHLMKAKEQGEIQNEVDVGALAIVLTSSIRGIITEGMANPDIDLKACVQQLNWLLRRGLAVKPKS